MHPLVLVAFLFPPSRSEAQSADPSLEYQVKAAYLVNFTRYVDWPAHLQGSSGSPIAICVLGEDPFGPALDHAAEGRTSHGRPITIRRVRSAQSAQTCHLVFLTDDEWGARREAVEDLTRQGVLTIGNSDQFARFGGVIGFVIVNETVRFVVNLRAQERAGLTISSRMLSLAAALHRGEGPGF